MICVSARLLLAIFLSLTVIGCTGGRVVPCRDDRGVEFYRERNAEWNRMMSPEIASGEPMPYYDARGVGHQPESP
jgi:hypothetical protein